MRFKALLNKIAKAAYQPYPCTPGKDCPQDVMQSENPGAIENPSSYIPDIVNNALREDCELCKKGCCGFEYLVLKEININNLSTIASEEGIETPFFKQIDGTLHIHNGVKNYRIDPVITLAYKRKACVSATRSHCDLLQAKLKSTPVFSGNVSNKPCRERIDFSKNSFTFQESPCESEQGCGAGYVPQIAPSGEGHIFRIKVKGLRTDGGYNIIAPFEMPGANQQFKNQLIALMLGSCRSVSTEQLTNITEATELEDRLEFASNVTLFAASWVLPGLAGRAAAAALLKGVPRASRLRPIVEGTTCAIAKAPWYLKEAATFGALYAAGPVIPDAVDLVRWMQLEDSGYALFRNKRKYVIQDSQGQDYNLESNGNACVIQLNEAQEMEDTLDILDTPRQILEHLEQGY
jgi:hypothetical protein